MLDLHETCTEACEAMPSCHVCGRSKSPRGRDHYDNGLCDQDCPGYFHQPRSGHLWMGELKKIREGGDAT